MEFKQLLSFVTVVQLQSFTRAAEKLFISQPTISTHIYQLEEELHVKLILRTTKSIQVTPKGNELYGYALNILELKERMLQSCSLKNQFIIHLGASTIPTAYVLPQLLPEFGRQNPDTYFVVEQSDSQGVINGMLDGLYDVGLIGMSCEDERLCCKAFCQDRLVLITPVNEHFLRYKQGGKTPVSELLREPIILREKGSGTEKLAERFLRGNGLREEELHIVARANDQEAIKNLVAGGLGVSLISEKAAHNFVQEKRILAFELPEYLSARNLYVIYRKNYLLSPCVKRFLQFVERQSVSFMS